MLKQQECLKTADAVSKRALGTLITKDHERHSLSAMITEQIPYLRRYGLALTRNGAEADDLVQDCMVLALSKMHLFTAGTNLRAWMAVMMRNTFVDGFRRARRGRKAYDLEQVSAEGRRAHANQLHHLQVLDMAKALSHLPEIQRSTVLLVAVNGLDYEQASRVTKVPVGTVRSRLSRARSMLKKMTEGTYLGETVILAA